MIAAAAITASCAASRSILLKYLQQALAQRCVISAPRHVARHPLRRVMRRQKVAGVCDTNQCPCKATSTARSPVPGGLARGPRCGAPAACGRRRGAAEGGANEDREQPRNATAASA